MASPGIYCGNIDNTVRSGDDSVILNHKLIEYQQDGSNSSLTTTSVLPNSIAMTEFHILVLSENRLRVICTLNEKQVWEDVFDSRDQVKNIWRDPVKGYIWINAKKGVYRYKVVQESRNIWKILLDMKEYDKARFHCGQDQEKLDIVNRQQANSLFEAGKYETSAQYYAQTRMSFEEITLKFIEANKEVALRGYLEKKLDNYRPEENKVQAIMLVTWLVEIWLNQLGKLSDQMDSDGSNKYEQEREILQEEFRLFLAKGNIRSVLNENKSIIYDLIASHGDVKDLVFFADLMKDYEKVISHQLQNHEFEKALEQLERVGDARLVYKFSPLLMQHVPSATVDLWQTLSPYHNPRRPPLDPKKLIPSLVQYDVRKLQSGQTHDAIRFLEYCIRTLKNKDQTIHNYLISLYADFDPEKLLKYLRVQGQEADAVNYDLKYALRLCSEKNLHKACIHIYSTMGLYSEAVNLALEQTDMSLAQENAQKPEEYDERKKLWLDVARHVVEKQKNIDSAMKVLKDCDLLKIEDILPFFPDFVTIDKFKEAITKSLAEYNEHINSLKADMNEATKSADQIRQQIQDFRKKSGTVRTTDKCSLCSFPLVTRSFYLFPCHHKFHSDCLIAEVLPSLSSSIRATVEELQRKVASREDAFSITSNTSTSFTQSAKAELDELVAAECIYCGEQIIRTIDEPFIALDEYGAATEDWD
ncbi:VPS18 [Bugula neritina]|uniref:Vacuolar protein sorting-associated protein 18 homolog n=1 Tax=Bugula neritina TaxID=10212 RepID=A0A7J7K1T6_BUGNE|nr:VPS18 [Bugula neritina]